jgi:hypothetical protein
MFRFSETESPMTHQFDLVIHALQSAIGDPELRPGEEAGEMIFYQPGKIDERFQSAVSSPPKPLFQMGLGSGFLPVVPEALKLFFEVVGPDKGQVKFQEMRESAAFLGGQVPGILQENKASPFQVDFIFPSQFSDFGSSYFIQGSVQMLDDMEAIKDQSGLRGMGLNGNKIGSPHIQTDGLKGSGPPLAQPSKEGIEGFLFSILAHPQEPVPFQIIDQGEVLMSFFAGDFIDAQDMQGFEFPLFQPLFYDPLDNGSHYFPVQPKIFGYFFEGEFFGQQGHGMSQGLRHSGPFFGPGNFFDFQPAAGALDAERSVSNPERFVSQREVLPRSLAESTSGSFDFQMALATLQMTVAQSLNLSHPTFVGLDDLGYKMSFHSQTFSDKSFHTHRPLISFPFDLQITERIIYQRSRCVSTLKALVAFWLGRKLPTAPSLTCS